jgi:hypothetical protein
MLSGLLLALLALWAVQLVGAVKLVLRVPPITRLPAPERTEWPTLTMVVPARDEGAQIAAALTAKLRSTYPALQVAAVDDRSSDTTGQILDRIAAHDPRVEVVHVASLPAGWLGKMNALRRGLELARGEWVLFSDADVHVEPGVLERLIDHAERERIDLIAVFPSMRPVHPILDGAVAYMQRVLFMAARWWSANDDRSEVAAGVGAFNLVRRSALETSGAIEALKMEIADDVGLGGWLKARGHKCRLFAGRGQVHLVFLDSLGAAQRSANKGGAMLRYSPLITIAAAAIPLLLELVLPILGLLQGGVPRVLGAGALVLATVTHLVITAHVRGPILGALCWWPFGAVVTSIVTLRSGFRAWRDQGVWWRGQFYPREVVEAGRRIEVPSLRMRKGSER